MALKPTLQVDYQLCNRTGYESFTFVLYMQFPGFLYFKGTSDGGESDFVDWIVLLSLLNVCLNTGLWCYY